MSDSNGNFIEKIVAKVRVYLVIIVILCVILCIYDWHWILPSIILVILLISVTYKEKQYHYGKE